MLIYKLELIGHVHDREHHLITAYHSYPHGVEEAEIEEEIDKFAKAYTLISIKTVPDDYVRVAQR